MISDGGSGEVQAATAVPRYYQAYEDAFDLRVQRPVQVRVVCDRSGRLRVETDAGIFSARGLINATGTWETPHVPDYPGRDRFRGMQLHTRDYVPEFRAGSFTPEVGRAAVALVEERVRKGLPPGSVVSVTRLPVTPRIRTMQQRGVLARRPMFSEITERRVRCEDGSELGADVILWCTGFRSALDHLAPLQLREDSGGIVMTGRLATQVSKDPRIHLVVNRPGFSGGSNL